MTSKNLLRIPRSDEADSFVLVHVSSAGSGELDLQLVGTESEAPYVSSVRQKTVHKLQGAKHPLSAEEWHHVLAYALLGKNPEGEGGFRKGFELVADITHDNLRLVFRQNIDGLKKPLGSLTLTKDEDQEIDLFTWAGEAFQKSILIEEEVLILNTKYESALDQVQTLNAQLDELTVAKEKHEEALIAKCAMLLNEKKRKIRLQQRALVSGKVDPSRVKELEHSLANRESRVPNLSNASKRKAIAPPDGSASEDGFVQMEVDDNQSAEIRGEGSNQTATPGRSEDEEETESEDDVEEEAEPDEESMSGPSSRIIAARKEAEDAKGPRDADLESPPPPRELPFNKKRVSPADQDETEGETEDDEL